AGLSRGADRGRSRHDAATRRRCMNAARPPEGAKAPEGLSPAASGSGTSSAVLASSATADPGAATSVGAPIFPGATLGVLGGGQLGRMFVQAAQSMGYFTVVLDPDAASPAGLVSHHHIHADYLDPQALAQLAQQCAAITTEFENVPAPALRQLAARRPVAPGADAVAIAQDRAREKAHFVACG